MTIRVLLADDHGIVRAGLRALLETQPELTVVGEAATGRLAVDEALRLRPDVVVLDIAMPELNGVEATRQIHAALPKIAIIILSMHSTHEHIYQAFRAGARGYVLKEAAGNELIAGISAVNGGRYYLSAKIANSMNDLLINQPGAATPNPLDQLTEREREILQLVVAGKSSIEIGGLIALSPKTVDSYRSRLMQKLGIKDLPTLVKFALQQGLTTLE
ncbi:MAG: response regulator transcription factor [Caldilineaceae bacterium]